MLVDVTISKKIINFHSLFTEIPAKKTSLSPPSILAVSSLEEKDLTQILILKQYQITMMK